MSAAKIQFSPSELSAINNTEFFLTKKAVVLKIYELFAQLVPHISASFISLFPPQYRQLFQQPAKISKGENYLGYPYVIMDYPASFSKDHSLAIRCFFWWGHFFSVEVLLTGEFKDHFINSLQKNAVHAIPNYIKICINESPWLHEFTEENFVSITDVNVLFSDLPFLKLGIKIELSEVEIVEQAYIKAFDQLAQILR